jgi:hypothetical protein
MTFVFPLLLGGLLLVGVPILLHLIMRQKPKHLLFPAFRFLVRRHRTNLRKLQLRHFLLLLLRVLLLAAIVLALAQPKISSQFLPFTADQPVAAVLVIDTRPSMGYVIEGKGGSIDLLERAKRRARELLNELPDGSRVAILDTAHPNRNWTTLDKAHQRIDQLRLRPDNFSVSERLGDAYDLLDKLTRDQDENARKLPRFIYVFSNRTQSSWDSSLLKKRQEDADRIPPSLERLEKLPDRARPLIELVRDLPERLQVSGGSTLAEQLQRLSEAIPSINPSDYPDANTIKLLGQVRAQLRAIIAQVEGLGDKVQEGAKEYRDRVLEQLQAFLLDFKGAFEVFIDVGVKEPQDLALLSLELPPKAGSEMPQQVFAPTDKIPLRVTVRAMGTTYNTHADCFLDGKAVDRKALVVRPGEVSTVSFEIDCGKEKLKTGVHIVEVRVPSRNRPKFVDGGKERRYDIFASRYVTFAIRQPRLVLAVADPVPPTLDKLQNLPDRALALIALLQKAPRGFEVPGSSALIQHINAAVYAANRKVFPNPDLLKRLALVKVKGGEITSQLKALKDQSRDVLDYRDRLVEKVQLFLRDYPDDADQPELWKRAVDGQGEFHCDVLKRGQFLKLGPRELSKYRAICLFEPASDDPRLWTLLEEYVKKGGGLVVMPPSHLGGDEDARARLYNKEAQKLLPGSLVKVIKLGLDSGAILDWKPQVFQHELLKPAKSYATNPGIDFVKFPRRAFRYWLVKPAKNTNVLIRYKDKANSPALLEAPYGKGHVVLFSTSLDAEGWNNYMADTSFSVMVPDLTLRYLAGRAEAVKLNYTSGEPVAVPLPPRPRRPPYYVAGPKLEDAPSLLTPPPEENLLQVKGAIRPGNYRVSDKEQLRVAAFSINLPASEADLSRVPESRIAALFGPKSVVPVSGDVKLRDALRDHWNPPFELLPVLLVFLLLTVVLESLLANKFYRREPDNPAETQG